MIQTGKYSKVSAANISDQGYRMAMNYQATKDAGAVNQLPGNLLGIVSSSDVTKNQQRTDANANAAGASSGITPTPQNITTTEETPLTPLAETTKNYQDETKNYINEIGSAAQMNLSALNAGIDSRLYSLDTNYNSLVNQLKNQAQNASEAAVATYASVDPYGMSRGNQAGQGYIRSIGNFYQSKTEDLTMKTEAARNALEAGRTQAYATIMGQAQKDIAQARQDVNKYMMDFAKQIEQTRQYEQTFGLSIESRAQDDLQSYINTMSGSPELQTEIKSYFATGKLTPGLAAVAQKGLDAGMSSNESLSLLQYQSDKVRTQQATEDYRTQQLLNATDRQTKAMNLATGMSNIQTKSQELIASGILPGTLDYAKGIAGATAGSQTGLNATETSGYTTIANIGSQLIDLKSSLDSLRNDNDIKNILLTKTGASVQSLTSAELALLTAKINAIAAPVARVMFGERGVLTEPDITRVMSTMPSGASTADVRDALYKQILINAKTGAINKLSIDASTYRNVTGVAPYIEQFVNEIDGVLNQMQGELSVPDDISSIFNIYKK